MMDQQRRQPGWPLVAGLVAVAAALGFGASHWLAARQVPVAVPAPAAAAGNDQADVEVPIPAEYLAIAKIAVEPVGSGGADSQILAPGAVVASPNGEAVIVARAAGSIARINRQLGDSVRAGEALAQVESSEGAGMAAERNTANAKAELARKSYAREASLFQDRKSVV